MKNIQKKLSVIFKRNPSEVKIGSCSTVILLVLQTNMNILEHNRNLCHANLFGITTFKPKDTFGDLMEKKLLNRPLIKNDCKNYITCYWEYLLD